MVSSSTALLRIDISELGAIDFMPGQFAQLQVPGTDVWRNYSYAHPADGRTELEFIIRLLPDGAMSNYLRDRAKPGDRIALRCSKGGFHLRPLVRPAVLVAGGTGLSAASVPQPRRSEEEGQGNAPATRSRAVLKQEGTVPPMPPGAFVKEEVVVPPMPPDAIVKREHTVVVKEEERSDDRPKRQRSK